jgi:hypothetical protein
MRWLVLLASQPEAKAPSGTAHAQPPGPGLPEHAPSVHTLVTPLSPEVDTVRERTCEDGGVIFDGFVHSLPDVDPTETREWLDSLDAVVDAHGRTRARDLLAALLE